MDEYISREEAIKELREVYEQEYPTASGDFDEYASHDVPNVLRNIPAADVQPVRHGRWVSEKVRKPNWKGVEHDYFQPNSCSVCHTGFAVRSNYCPNCGARMDGESDE